MIRWVVSIAVVVAANAAHADTPLQRPEATEVDRMSPPPGRAEMSFESGAPIGAWAAEADLGYLDRPIVLRAGDIVTHPVDHRETLALGGALSLGEEGRLVVDARMPFSHQVGDRLIGLGGHAYLDHWVLGDIALGARVGITSTTHVATFVRLAATLPTGDDHSFAGEARWTYSSQLVGRFMFGDVVIAATGGILLRPTEVQIGDRVLGDAAFGAIGAAVGLPPVAGLWCQPDQLRVTAELVGELGDKVGGVRGPSPAEARVGLIGRPWPGVAVGARAGFGLDDQVGSPRFRAMVELVWQAPAPAVHEPVEPPSSDDEGE